ncbi:MAG: hypothetical protein ACRYHA_29965 [Janthinobacterium lividum]
MLRSIEQNDGQLSNVLAKEMPVLTQSGVWTEIVEAVSQAFQDGARLTATSLRVTIRVGLRAGDEQFRVPFRALKSEET